jgi:hypothetical protein
MTFEAGNIPLIFALLFSYILNWGLFFSRKTLKISAFQHFTQKPSQDFSPYCRNSFNEGYPKRFATQFVASANLLHISFNMLINNYNEV